MKRRPSSSCQCPYLVHDLRQAPCDVVVLKVTDAQAELAQTPVPLVIRLRLLGSPMHASVYFDDQCSWVAVEICNESGNDLLAPEMHAEPVPAQFLPQEGLCRRHLPAHVLGALELLRRNLLTRGDVFLTGAS